MCYLVSNLNNKTITQNNDTELINMCIQILTSLTIPLRTTYTNHYL